MGETERFRLAFEQSHEVDDPVLDDLHKELTESDIRWRGSDESPETHTPPQLEKPFDLEVVKPRAIDVKKLYRAAKQPLPPEVKAALGPSSPILICHGMTPFHPPGERPAEIWGMGYMTEIDGIDASTISVQPGSEFDRIASTQQRISFGLTAGGEIQIPPEILEVVSPVPGISIYEAHVNATNHSEFALSISFAFSLLHVQAGPLANGGARWNIYRRSDSIDHYHALFQTVLIPPDVEELTLVSTAWVKRRGALFGLVGTRMWTAPKMSFTVSLDGLST